MVSLGKNGFCDPEHVSYEGGDMWNYGWLCIKFNSFVKNGKLQKDPKSKFDSDGDEGLESLQLWSVCHPWEYYVGERGLTSGSEVGPAAVPFLDFFEHRQGYSAAFFRRPPRPLVSRFPLPPVYKKLPKHRCFWRLFPRCKYTFHFFNKKLINAVTLCCRNIETGYYYSIFTPSQPKMEEN